MDLKEWLEKADQYAAGQKWNEAADNYTQALNLDPANTYIFNQLGIVYEELDEADKAEYNYKSALQLDPKIPNVRYNLGMFYKSQGRTVEAQRELESFLRLTTNPKEQAEAKEILTELSGLAYEKCTKCGCISPLRDAFERVNRELVCPRCYSQIQLDRLAKGYLAAIFLFLSLAALFYGLYFLVFQSNFPPNASQEGASQRALTAHYIFINFLLLFLFKYLLIIPHELAHAIGAWLVKGRVFEIRVGLGPNILERTIGNLTISLYRYPALGACIAAFPNRGYIIPRFVIFTAAAPLFHIFVLLILLPGFEWSNLISSFAFQEVFVLVNMGLLVISLIPRQIKSGDFSVASDGLQLVRAVSGKVKDEMLHVAYFLLESLYALKTNHYEQAINWCKAGLQLYPNDISLKNTLGVAMIELEQHAEALTLFENISFEDQQYLKEMGASEVELAISKAILLTNIAYVSLLNYTHPDNLKKARIYSEEAFRMVPWHPSIQGTWGAVLVETGAMQEGIEHLSQIFKYNSTHKSKAMNLAQTAIGYHRIGESQKAKELLNDAIALDSEGYMVKKAQIELGPV